MLKTAIIGVTGYGSEHLRILQRGVQAGYLTAEAAVVINPEQAEDKVRFLTSIGCRIYGSVETMWDEEKGNIDLCMIPTSIATHYPFARKAIACGADVFLEKPACATIQDTLELDQFAKSQGRKICVGFQDIYSPQVQLIKRWLVSGRFGAVRHMRAGGCWPRAVSYFQRNSWAGRIKDSMGWVLDSPVNNAMAHFLNLMLYWAGRTEAAYAVVRSIEADLFQIQEIESFDTASLRVWTDADVDLLFAVTHSCERCVDPVIHIECERGSILWNHSGPIRYTLDGVEEVVSQPWMHVIRDGMMDAVAAYLTTGRGHVCLLQDTLSHTRCVNALHQYFPIRTVSGEFKQTRALGADMGLHVPGIEGLIQNCLGQGKLLRDQGAPWAQGWLAPVDLTDYNHFSGVYTPAAQEAKRQS